MTRSRPAAHSLALAFALTLSATGCGKLREVSACRGVARETNRALDEIEVLSRKTPVDEPRIAERYAALAKALQPRSKGEQPLALAVREYVSVLEATSLTLRNHAAASKLPYARTAEFRRELERLVKREHAATLRIDVECHN
jgi:hypothetical protein